MTAIAVHRNSENPQPVFVAMFDILGFRGRLTSYSLEQVVEDYRRLMQAARVRAAAIPIFSETHSRREVLGTAIFSDTIFLWCDDTWEAIQSLLTGSAWLVAAAIDMGAPLRGGVAYGRCVIDARAQTFVGQAIVDAYQTEQCQEWAGAALHQSVIDHASLGNRIVRLDDVRRYPVPRKEEAPPLAYAVHWCPFGSHSRQRLQTLLDQTADLRARAKLEATLQYVETMCSNYDSAR